MSAMQEFIEKWNGSIEHFKMTSEFLENPTSKSVMDALESLLLYMEFDIDAIKDTPVKHDIPSIPVALINVLRCIREIHENISTMKKIFCLGDIYKPSPKRTLRILCELHNFVLYYKCVTAELKADFDKIIEERAKKRADRDELTDKENALSSEVYNWHHRAEKSAAKLPGQEERGSIELEIREMMQDNKELEPRLQQCRQQLIQVEKKGFQLKEKNDMLKGQRVLDPELLESRRNDVKMQAQLQNDLKTSLETAHKAKMKHRSNTMEVIQKSTQLLAEDKKNIELAGMCIKIKEECSTNIDQNDLKDLQKQYEAAKNTTKIKKSDLDLLKEHIATETNDRKVKVTTLHRRVNELHEESIDIQKYIKDSQSAINYAEDVTEQLENMTREQIQKKHEFQLHIQELIADVDREAYEHCIKYKPTQE